MFGRFKKKEIAPPPAPTRSMNLAMRETLFGDMLIAQWPSAAAPADAVSGEPWRSFMAARDALAAGRTDEAIDTWKSILAQPSLESRSEMQAWTFLRAHGVTPDPSHAKRLLGIVIEVPVDGGLDLLAVYPERTARYYHHAGGALIWERPNGTFDDAIGDLLHTGQATLNAIGPWDRERPGPPRVGEVRLNFLSPAGLHFGQASFQTFSDDPLAKPVLMAGLKLQQQLLAYKPK